MGNKNSNQIVQKRAGTLEQFKEDVYNANQILKTYKDSSGKIIKLTLDITNFDLVKETTLWKLFVRVYVSLVNPIEERDKNSCGSNSGCNANSNDHIIHTGDEGNAMGNVDLNDRNNNNNNNNNQSNSNNNSLRNSIDKSNVQNILKYGQFYQFMMAVQEIIESGETSMKNNNKSKLKKQVSKSSVTPGGDYDEDDEFSIPINDIYKRASWQIEDSRECPICFEDDQLSVVPCGHAFCSDCINQWRSRNNTCPMCRTLGDDQDEMDFVLVEEAQPEEISTYFQTILKDTR
ncbi:hypothetical protein PPL_09915 [Heterostelium album PN500]|uniref:RING-type domain-containing protein n=1 Tax=Heterostelium pallidum (strain ATCC 26659 / Pp 5 / PN500) TaxID=670386 RepID=D3BPP8_HETP5|nr:hypothetical protein PPL_09915 [Heterostelium album PN500]EFA76610.1 hypothetical protein PPL_09915 [Heterostelium album PN500]|eukprot:XP_020428742.1 hypothetical protein PPL_09915 [Heterostelium album PN500]